MHTRTKENGTQETRYFNARGEITKKVRNPDQGDTDTQDYDYDFNGNRTQDERGDERFNPRRQLVWWERGTDYDDPDNNVEKAHTAVTYKRTDSGDIDLKIDDWQPTGYTTPTTTDFNYLGERLLSTETSAETVDGPVSARADYRYDELGSVRAITTAESGAGQEPPPPATDNGDVPPDCPDVPDTVEDHTTRYCFDEFERMVRSQGPGVDHPANYEYDGLDRRDTRKRTRNGEPTTHDFSYVGTSRLLSRETDTDSDGNTEIHDYDYDSQGHRLGQSRRPKPTETDPNPSAAYRTYATDANGSVTGLENADGQFGPTGADTYLYDPYGENEKVGATAEGGDEAGLSDTAQSNPFRFEGFYYDSGVKSYDMQAREYRPDSGRYLSQDRYESAVDDRLLQADPLTQNRYAFAGGNPVNNVEFDGHRVDTRDCNGRPKCVKAVGDFNSGNNHHVAQNTAHSPSGTSDAYAGAPANTHLQSGDTVVTAPPIPLAGAWRDPRGDTVPQPRPVGAYPGQEQICYRPLPHNTCGRWEGQTLGGPTGDPYGHPSVEAPSATDVGMVALTFVGGEELLLAKVAERVAPKVTPLVKKGITRLFGRSADDEVELGKYAKGKGHHVPAKSAFRGDPAYRADEALAIPKAQLERLGIDHNQITAAQNTLYRKLAASGESPTWQNVARIEQQSLEFAGMQPRAASSVVRRAIANLQQNGIQGPTRIPWGG